MGGRSFDSGFVGTVWELVKDFKHYLDRPQLAIDKLRTDNFRFIHGGGNGRYILGRVTNVGGIRAENCLAQVIVDDDAEKEFKLHWCDESWEARRDSAPKIDLEPTESRDLDIAFSIFQNLTKTRVTKTSSYGPVMTTDPPYAHQFPKKSSSSPGTLAPTSSNIDFEPVKLERMGGAFIATPASSLDFNPSSKTYLPPGKHHLEIRLILSGGGDGFVTTFDIISGTTPMELNVVEGSVRTNS